MDNLILKQYGLDTSNLNEEEIYEWILRNKLIVKENSTNTLMKAFMPNEVYFEIFGGCFTCL